MGFDAGEVEEEEEEEEGLDVIVGVVVKRGEENREVRKVVGEGREEEEGIFDCVCSLRVLRWLFIYL
jgi:hypothetical protein